MTPPPVPRRSVFGRPLFAAFGVAIPLLFVSQLLISCGSDNKSSSACAPGKSTTCVGPGQCAGIQICNDQGSGYDTCDCGGAASGTGGSSAGAGGSGTGGTSSTNTAGNGGAGAGPLYSGGVGTPCNSDADCPGAPLICLLSSSNTEFPGGGPQDGYCSLPCTTTLGDCAPVDDFSACGLIDPNTKQGYCLGLCVPGTSQTAVKCGQGRPQACYQNPNNASAGICLPLCTSDAACGAGRFCDPGGLGLCLDQAPAGGAIGAACDPTLMVQTDCASQICLSFTDATPAANVVGSFCSASCTFGDVDTCGYDPNGTAPRQAACLTERFSGGGPGDLGFCIPLCDTAADCAQQANGWTCELFGADLSSILGRGGQCVPPDVGADAGPG